MTTASVIVACILTALAALMTGLWYGERGRRKAAENLLTIGAPERVKPMRVSPRVMSEDIARKQGQPFSDETLKRGTTKYIGEMKAAGYELTEEEARMHVEQMLWQATTGSAMPDEQAGIFG